METNILTENGTNELELLEFLIGDRHYGINVAKVSEIISYQEVTPIPNTHPSVEGVFMPRDHMITAVDLKSALQLGSSDKSGLFIVTNFNLLDMAFHIGSVVGIYKVSWKDVMKPSQAAGDSSESLSTGIIKHKDRLITILDFEKIITIINPEIGLKVHEVEKYADRSRIDIPIVISEDSPLLNKMIAESLEKAGYTKLIHTEDGQEAWDLIRQWKNEGTLKDNIQCLITDIEMPRMDGHRLTKLVKEDNATNYIKVVIFSSMINDDMRKKGEKLGADEQLTKPEIGLLVDAMDRILGIKDQD